MKRFTHTLKLSVALCAFLTVLIVAPIAASAHVQIDPSTAKQGGQGTFTFNIPNETEDANTTKIQVQFPTEHPIASVKAYDPTGWTNTSKMTTLSTPITDLNGKEVDQVVSEITWEGGSIAPEETGEFQVDMGPLPDSTDTLTFRVLQTYDNGEVVSWIQDPEADGSEPPFPAPTINLTPGETSATADDARQDEVAPTPISAVPEEDSEDSDVSPWVLVAIAVGVVALIVGIIALAKAKKSQPDDTTQSENESAPETSTKKDLDSEGE